MDLKHKMILLQHLYVLGIIFINTSKAAADTSSLPTPPQIEKPAGCLTCIFPFECAKVKVGMYQSCDSCKGSINCTGVQEYELHRCDSDLQLWDDVSKSCSSSSQTCPCSGMPHSVIDDYLAEVTLRFQGDVSRIADQDCLAAICSLLDIGLNQLGDYIQVDKERMLITFHLLANESSSDPSVPQLAAILNSSLSQLKVQLAPNRHVWADPTYLHVQYKPVKGVYGECKDKPCGDHGRCTPMTDPQASQQFTCSCAQGYDGMLCQQTKMTYLIIVILFAAGILFSLIVFFRCVCMNEWSSFKCLNLQWCKTCTQQYKSSSQTKSDLTDKDNPWGSNHVVPLTYPYSIQQTYNYEMNEALRSTEAITYPNSDLAMAK